MSNKEIIEKLLKKINFFSSELFKETVKAGYVYIGVTSSGDLEFVDEREILVPYVLIIFSPAFARKLWGTELIESDEIINEHEFYSVSLEAWKYHLQKMVICKSPLEYISKFV